jgi:hypothetical protein
MSSDDYEVGYGKPPKHSQFKSGQSGNPSGRRKKPRESLRELLLREGEKRHRLVLNGKEVSRTRLQISVLALWNKAMKGDLKAFQMLMALYASPKAVPTGPPNWDDWDGVVTLVLEEEPPPHIRAQQIANGFGPDGPGRDVDFE